MLTELETIVTVFWWVAAILVALLLNPRKERVQQDIEKEEPAGIPES